MVVVAVVVVWDHDDRSLMVVVVVLHSPAAGESVERNNDKQTNPPDGQRVKRPPNEPEPKAEPKPKPKPKFELKSEFEANSRRLLDSNQRVVCYSCSRVHFECRFWTSALVALANALAG